MIDDPISSLDYNRRNHTVGVIFDLLAKCQQGIILSHDPDFLHHLWTKMGITPSERTALQIKRTGNNESSITNWDVEMHAESEQKDRIQSMQSFVNEGLQANQTLQQVISCVRPCLEHAYKALYPKEFPSSSTLGSFVGTVRLSSEAYLVNIKSRLDRISSVNDYVTSYSSHDPSTTTQALNETELVTNVQETLNLLRA